MRIKHTIRTMILWETMTKKSWSISSMAEAAQYAWLCYTTYNDNAMSFDDFCDAFPPRDLARFYESIGDDLGVSSPFPAPPADAGNEGEDKKKTAAAPASRSSRSWFSRFASRLFTSSTL